MYREVGIVEWIIITSNLKRKKFTNFIEDGIIKWTDKNSIVIAYRENKGIAYKNYIMSDYYNDWRNIRV